MENPGETDVLDSFSHQYEVNSNEKVYSEGTTGKVEAEGQMEKSSGETRDVDGGPMEGEDGFHGIDARSMMDAGNGHADEEKHGDGDGLGDEDVLMADVDAEDGFVGGGEGDVKQEEVELIGDRGLDQAQSAVAENGKQNGRPHDPFASPEDQPMPQAESPATQNIYDLQSSWPQAYQPLAGYEDIQRQPEEHPRPKSTPPAEVLSEEDDEVIDEVQDYANETLTPGHLEQSSQEGNLSEISEARSGEPTFQEDLVPYVQPAEDQSESNTEATGDLEEKYIKVDTAGEHLDPYDGEAAGHLEQEFSEEVNDNTQEQPNTQGFVVDHLEKELPHEELYPSLREADEFKPESTDKEKDTEQQNLDLHGKVIDLVEQEDDEKEKDTREQTDPYEGVTVDNFGQESTEKEINTPKEHADPYDRASNDCIEEDNENYILQEQEQLDPCTGTTAYNLGKEDTKKEEISLQEDSYEAAGGEFSEGKDIESEKYNSQEKLHPHEAVGEDFSEEKDIEKEKEIPHDDADPYDAAPEIDAKAVRSAEEFSEKGAKEKQNEILHEHTDPYDAALGDNVKATEDVSEEKDIEKEKEISHELPDLYDATQEDDAKAITTELQQELEEDKENPYTSEQLLGGRDKEEVYQDLTHESKELSGTIEQEIDIDQGHLQISQEIVQEHQPETVEEGKENILSEVEQPYQSMELEEGSNKHQQGIDKMEGDAQMTTESVSLGEEASFVEPSMQKEDQYSKEHIEEEEQLLDPYAPENADMDVDGNRAHSQESEQLGQYEERVHQDSIQPDFNAPPVMGKVAVNESEIGYEATTELEENETADEHQLYSANHEVAQRLDEQAEDVAERLNEQAEIGTGITEMLIDPIEAVIKANSEENLLGLETESAASGEEQSEEIPDNLQPVDESKQQNMLMHPLEQTDLTTTSNEDANTEDIPDSMQALVDDGEDAPTDEQDTNVNTEDNKKSFQSGSDIQSSDSLASKGLSEIDVEPSQQFAEDISTSTAPVADIKESVVIGSEEVGKETATYDENKIESDAIESEEEGRSTEEAMEPQTSQTKPAVLPLLDLGDGPVQSLSIAEVDQSPSQRSFEGSFSPIEDNVEVSLALEDQSGPMECKEHEESDEDAHTETTEVEAELKEDKYEQEAESRHVTSKELPKEDTSLKDDPQDVVLDEKDDTSIQPSPDISYDNLGESDFGTAEGENVSAGISETMQSNDGTCLPGDIKVEDEYNQDEQQKVVSVGVDLHEPDKREDNSAGEVSQEPTSGPSENLTPDIVMQEFEDHEVETEQMLHGTPDVSTDTTLQNTADILSGESKETDALIMERSRISATPPNTPDVVSSSPPEITTDLSEMRENLQTSEDLLVPEAEQFKSYSDPMVQSVVEHKLSTEELLKQEVEAAPDEKAPTPEVRVPSVPASTTPEVSAGKSSPDAVEKKKLKSGSAEEKKPKISTSTKSPAKKPSSATPQKTKTSDKSKTNDIPKKTAATSKSQPKPTALGEKKDSTRTASRSPAKTPSKMPTTTPSKSAPKTSSSQPSPVLSKAPAKAPTKTPTKTPTKASPKVPACATRVPTSAKKTTGMPSAGVAPARSRTAPAKVDVKLAESKPKQDQVKMSGVKQKTVTTVTKTTTTEVRSAKSSPRKSADGDSPRVRHSPGRNGVTSKIGSLENSRHSPGGGNVKIQSEKTNYSKVQSRCGSLGNSTHKAGGGNVKIFDERVDFRTRANSRVGSLDNAHHSPGGGNVKILHDPVTFIKPASRVGSLDNAHHTPQGGKVKFLNKVYSRKSKGNYLVFGHREWQKDHNPTNLGSIRQSQQGECATHDEILHDPVSFPKSSVSSKIGSLDNAQHSPGGGNVKIVSASVDFTKKAKSKVGSLDNARHSPRGGNVKILNQSVDFSKVAKSKVGSLDNATHSPGGGNVKIENKKVDFSKKVTSKIGSLDNATHKAGGGKVKIENKKLDFKEKAASKIGSKDNIKHQAGGGQVKIENKKLDFKEKASSKVGSKDNIEHKPGGGQVKIPEEKLEFKSKASSKVGSLDNAQHKPGGGDVKILDEKLEFGTKAQSKVGSLDNAAHQPGGGDVKILDEKLEFSSKAQSKVGSLDNADHQPSGGDVKIFDEKLTFQRSTSRQSDGTH